METKVQVEPCEHSCPCDCHLGRGMHILACCDRCSCGRNIPKVPIFISRDHLAKCHIEPKAD